VFVTGSSNRAGTATDYVTFAYNASTGARLWSARYDGPGHWYDNPTSMVLGPAGTKLFVTGFVFGPDVTEDYGTVAYAV
jgi:hypothetical protein